MVAFVSPSPIFFVLLGRRPSPKRADPNLQSRCLHLLPIQVFTPDQRACSRPYSYLSQEDAQRLCDEGFATPLRSGRSIRLKEFGTIKLRDRSCSWSHRLMELVGEGNYAACKMLGWLEEYRIAA